MRYTNIYIITIYFFMRSLSKDQICEAEKFKVIPLWMPELEPYWLSQREKEWQEKHEFFKGLKIGVTTKKFSRFDAAASFSVMNVWRRREESKSVWTEFPSACRLYFVSIADEWLKYVGFAISLPGFGANWSTDSQN